MPASAGDTAGAERWLADLDADSLRRMQLALGPGPVIRAAAQAQTWPSRPVRLLVGYAAGGPVDVTARIMGRALGRLDSLVTDQ
mgnify:CR=1 FL=1